MNLHKHLETKQLATLTVPVLGIGGAAAAMLGGVVGGFIGMILGGNFPVLFEYGGLPGYEGAAWLGAMLGALAVGLGLVAWWTRATSVRRQLLAVFAGLWVAAFIAEHFIVLLSASRNGSFVPMMMPSLLTSLVGFTLLRRKS